MKYLLLIFISLIPLLSQAQDARSIKTIKFKSESLNQEREVFIYTPPYYNENIHDSYNVVYVFDSQNKSLFDLAHSALFFSNDSDLDNPHIVVGIPAFWSDDPDYFYNRSSDFLPEPQYDKKGGWFYGQANFKNFFKFINTELIPYVDANYRTLPNRVLIGHSLSASFVLQAFNKNPDIAKGYLVISPNLKYDRQRLVKEVVSLEDQPLNKFVYFSHVEEDHGFVLTGDGLRQVENKLKSIVYFEIDSILNKSHHTTYLQSVVNGYSKYFEYLAETGYYKPKPIKITVKVPNKEDEVYISGNQDNLANYEDGKVILQRSSDLIREIKLDLPSSTYIRFTGGPNKTEAIMKSIDLKEMVSFPIDVQSKKEYQFEITGWQEEAGN
ncbi:MAG: alpha/beta hydrolase-fold protein [Bacteroidota bacterium]